MWVDLDDMYVSQPSPHFRIQDMTHSLLLIDVDADELESPAPSSESTASLWDFHAHGLRGLGSNIWESCALGFRV